MPQLLNIAEWRDRVVCGETLLTVLQEECEVINNPTPDTVNAIIQEPTDWKNRVILFDGQKYTVCLPTPQGWLVLDKPMISPKYAPQILGAIAAETDQYIRETYVLAGMNDHDILNYLEKLS